MKTAIESLETVCADERMREMQKTHEKSRLDMISKLNYVKKQGIQQGLQEGIQQGKLNTAQEMLRLGVDIQVIVKEAGLSFDTIKEIENRLKSFVYIAKNT